MTPKEMGERILCLENIVSGLKGYQAKLACNVIKADDELQEIKKYAKLLKEAEVKDENTNTGRTDGKSKQPTTKKVKCKTK